MSVESFETTSWGWQIYQWQTEVGEWFEYHFSRWLLRSFNNVPNFSIPPWLENLLKLLFWILLCLFLVWVGWRLWQKFSPYVYSRLRTVNNNTSSNVRQPENISVTGWWERSQEFYQQGNYGDACRCLYLAILQYLHDNQVIPKKASRTDGEYLQLLQLSGTPIQPYETLITTHEQLCFSDREISPDNYQQCQQAYGEITKQ
ncbi:MAG: DUF4129 domain-containing protein [Calothrix sp. MO_192.B10]|nr:DUF4129 domain-containing protein [Calothrix sp. MO_192.B10]